MTNTTLNGYCPHPFLQEDLFPSTGGFLGGRYCDAVATSGGNVSCCLPCPLAEWTYGDDVLKKTRVAGWTSVAILPLCIFLLISYAVLPAKWTHRHYLNICFTLGICFMEIAFIIPLGVNPEQCLNAITPNDMHSSLSCAFTGTLLLFGGWVVIAWSFIRTVAFHLQVCWEVMLGSKFMWASFICGWGIPVVGTTLMLIFTGVSYRFGGTCHINIDKSLRDYWIPITSFAVAALVLQVATMAYCIHVYVRSLFDKDTTTNSSGLPSYSASIATVTARQAYKRIKRVLQLQWRGVALVLIIIGNVIFFAVVFIRLNNALTPTEANVKKAIPWLLCLVKTDGNKNYCARVAAGFGPNQATLLALLIILSLVGLWNFLLFARPSMFLGWADLFKTKFGKRNDFVSADANRYTPDSRAYEMITNSAIPSLKTPEPVVRAPTPGRLEGAMSPTASEHYGRTTSPTTSERYGRTTSPTTSEHYGRDAKYVRPPMSFSRPRPTSPPQAGDWDPKSSFAPAHSRDNSGA